MKELWVPVSGAIAQQKQLDTVSNNVANINTPGFKKEQIIFKEYLTALEKGHDEIDLPNKEWAPGDFYKSYGSENAFVKVDGTYTDHTQSDVRPTNNPLDVAINGKGFFEVLGPNGIRYTRNGAFSLNRDGTLVTKEGFPILSKYEGVLTGNNEGATTPGQRTIKIDQGKAVITQNGDIYVNDVKVGTISVAEFNDPVALSKEGNGLFINKDPANLLAGEHSSLILQGFLEGSNVNPLEEMTNLIKANRNFESIQRAIKTYDSMAGRSHSELTKF